MKLLRGSDPKDPPSYEATQWLDPKDTQCSISRNGEATPRFEPGAWILQGIRTKSAHKSSQKCTRPRRKANKNPNFTKKPHSLKA